MAAFGGVSSRRTLNVRMAKLIGMLGIVGTVGNVWFVSSVSGVSGNDGMSPSKPVPTVAAAHTLATANNGDVIVLLPGHAETYTISSGASPLTITKAGLRIVGSGLGNDRPQFTASATDSAMLITGRSTYLSNIVWIFTNVDAVVVGISVDETDVTFDNCEFRTNASAAGCVSGVTLGATTACDRFKFTNCRFLGPATNSGTTTTAQITITAGVDYEISNCYLTGKCTQNITNGAAVLRGSIHNNRFVTATGTKCINMHASSTPFITSNRINVPSGTAPIVAAAGFVAGNIYSAAAGVTAGTASTI